MVSLSLESQSSVAVAYLNAIQRIRQICSHCLVCSKIKRNHYKILQNGPKRVPETLKKNQKLFENCFKITGKFKISSKFLQNFFQFSSHLGDTSAILLPITRSHGPKAAPISLHFISPNFFSIKIKTNLRGRPPFLARQISGRAIQ